MIRRGARRGVAGATAVGLYLMRHKIVGGVAIMFVLAAIVAGSTFSVLGRGTGQTFPGTSAVGSHQFYDLDLDTENTFCNACHSLIRDELTAGPHGVTELVDCLFCHAAEADQHVADFAQCADCHYAAAGGASCHNCHFGGDGPPLDCMDCHFNGAVGHGEPGTALPVDAHASFYDSVGETPETASWVCKACHTAVTVDMTVIQNPDLPLHIGPTYETPAP